MSLTSSEQGVARYLHASLERFTSAAVRDISARFHNAVKAKGAPPGSLSLSYDENEHVFTLSCHSNIGAQLDEVLGRTIRDYVASEAADVIRFDECAYGDPFDDYDIPLEKNDSPSPLPETSTIHIVNFDGINVLGKAKGFRLRELPSDLRDRACSRHSTSHLANTVSLRRVRWDEPNRQHVFDGGVREQLPKLSTAKHRDVETLCDLLPFTAFIRKLTVNASRDPAADKKHWEFVGPKPTVGQWLEGMGETRQVNPDAAPDIAKDAMKYASGQLFQQTTAGRLRLPQGVSPAELRPAEAADEPTRLENALNDNFAALLRSNATADSDTESSSSSNTESDNLNNTPQVFSASRQPPNTPVPVQLPNTTSELSDRTNGAPSTTQATTTRSGESFPTYDRSYARTDRWGLTGDANNQVQWEKENAATERSSRPKRAPTTYEEFQWGRAESDSMSMAGGVTSPTPMTYRETVLGGSEPWAKNVVPPQIYVPTGTLITTGGESRRSAPPLPPGLFIPLGSSGYGGRQASFTNHESLSVQESPSNNSFGEPLIQLDEQESPVVELLQPETQDQPRLFRTMRQQAKQSVAKKKNKGKGNGNKTGGKSVPAKSAESLSAALERPPPPPLPKQSNDKQTLVHHSSSPVKTDAGHENDGDVLSPTMLEQAVYTLTSSTVDRSPRVQVQFGMALLTDSGDLATDKAMRREGLQSKVDTRHRSVCFPRVLGRERVDGVYLLQLPATWSASPPQRIDGTETTLVDAFLDQYGIQERRLYDMSVVASDGREWTVSFDQRHPEDAKITLTGDNHQSVYVHYPQRVWDARVRSEVPSPKQIDAETEPDENLEQSILLFLKTLHSGPEADNGLPSFEAVMPEDARFALIHVLAKREFYQVLESGSAWIVSQVWDLHVHSAHTKITVSAKDEAVMRKEGRYWWEAALRYDSQEGLEATMNEIVEKLDWVGGNSAPNSATKEKKKPSTDEQRYVPYW